jgi:pyrroloquinoline quinone (PQQ) biosynthesis protein C
MEFFHVHIEGDTEHAHIGLELTQRYAPTVETQERAIACVRASAAMRYAMLDGILSRLTLKNAA